MLALAVRMGTSSRRRLGPLRSNNLSTLLLAAREGLGIAVLPRYVAEESIASGAVHPLLDGWALPAQEIHAVYPSPRMVPAKVTQFIEWLRGQFGPTWWARGTPGAGVDMGEDPAAHRQTSPPAASALP